jgi:hypothetical protein
VLHPVCLEFGGMSRHGCSTDRVVLSGEAKRQQVCRHEYGARTASPDTTTVVNRRVTPAREDTNPRVNLKTQNGARWGDSGRGQSGAAALRGDCE